MTTVAPSLMLVGQLHGLYVISKADILVHRVNPVKQ